MKGIWICNECGVSQPEPRSTDNGDNTETWDTSCIECKHDECSYIKPADGVLYTFDHEMIQSRHDRIPEEALPARQGITVLGPDRPKACKDGVLFVYDCDILSR